MALITLAGRSHVLGQLFDVLAPYSGKTGLQVCQFLVRQENILVTAIGVGGVSLLYLSLSLSLSLTLSLSLSLVDECRTNVRRLSEAQKEPCFGVLQPAFARPR